MDMDIFKPALRSALERLPREIVETVPALVAKHLDILEKVAPAIVDDLVPHLKAAMTEMALGVLDKDEFMNGVKEVLESFGIKDPTSASAA
jgi:hypothetical protein